MSEKEHLLRFRLRSGELIDMDRQDGNVILSNEHHRVIIPHATGKQALDLMAFLEPMGEVVDETEETEGGKV